MELHHLRSLIQKGLQAPGGTPAEHHAPPHTGLPVLDQQNPALPVRQVAMRCRGCGLRRIGPLTVVVPDVWPFTGQLHVDRFSLSLVRAEVAATILELLQMFDGVGSARSGHSAHTKWQWHLRVNIHHTHLKDGLRWRNHFCLIYRMTGLSH